MSIKKFLITAILAVILAGLSMLFDNPFWIHSEALSFREHCQSSLINCPIGLTFRTYVGFPFASAVREPFAIVANPQIHYTVNYLETGLNVLVYFGLITILWSLLKKVRNHSS